MNEQNKISAQTDRGQSTHKSRRNTQQKQIILDALVSLGSHASAGAVYKEVQREHPEIGRATVFRVLGDMADDGKLLRIKNSDTDDRYDITLGEHYHVLCKSCGEMVDLTLSSDPNIRSLIEESYGFDVEEIKLEFFGLCEKCRTEKIKNDRNRSL